LSNRPVPILAKVGSTSSAAGRSSYGHVTVNGQLIVDGVVNARQYAYQGVPFVPALKAVLPGVSLPDLLQAWQQAAEAARRADEADEKPSEPKPNPEPSPPVQNAPRDHRGEPNASSE
jgi:hypothetical protein